MYRFIYTILIFNNVASANCDQRIYDGLYKAIIRQFLTKPVTHSTYLERNNLIENLRALCKGQRSSYEIR